VNRPNDIGHGRGYKKLRVWPQFSEMQRDNAIETSISRMQQRNGNTDGPVADNAPRAEYFKRLVRTGRSRREVNLAAACLPCAGR
jgi:hypothetical protein